MGDGGVAEHSFVDFFILVEDTICYEDIEEKLIRPSMVVPTEKIFLIYTHYFLLFNYPLLPYFYHIDLHVSFMVIRSLFATRLFTHLLWSI